MKAFKLLAVVGLAVALVTVPALSAEKEVTVTCDATNNAIKVSSNPIRLNISDTVKWVISGERDKSVGNCKVKDGKPDKEGKTLQELGLNKVEIAVEDAALLTLDPRQQQWKAGQDSTIKGTPRKVGESKYSIKFYKDTELLLEVKEASVLVIQVTPTLTEWGLIALAVLLAGGMGYMLYRRPALRPAAP